MKTTTAPTPTTAGYDNQADTTAGKDTSAFRSKLRVVWNIAFWAFILLMAGFVVAHFAFDVRLTRVMSGSMEPTIMTGDRTITAPPSEDNLVEVGDVVGMNWEAADAYPALNVTHRVLAIDEDGLLTTQGDANPVADEVHTKPEDVTGVVVYTIPQPVSGVLDQFIPDPEWISKAQTAALTDHSAIPNLKTGAPWGFIVIFAWIMIPTFVKKAVLRAFRKTA